MPKKRKSPNQIRTRPGTNKNEERQGIPRSKIVKNPRWVIPLILGITFLSFIPVLNAGFVNWDDDYYVKDNPLMKDFLNLKLLITTPVQGNYHPLTILSLCINYLISGLNPWSYHLFNLTFHLINCFLVFHLGMLLSNRNIIIAFTTAILFGIHPMHVESVAWVSARKDVLYSIFFLAGLISYTKYIDAGSRTQYFFAILLMVLSLLSKPAAVVFPVVRFVLIYCENEK